ncbi:MAG: MFS transporter [Saprospiraceae bacterium]|nr:MFS transporter [Saprospiraceae bacterium]
MTISKNPYEAIKIRDFRFYLLMRMCSTLAIQMMSVLVGWQIYDITKDPLSLGLIGLVEAIPAISVALYAGHLADIVIRKKIALTCLFVLIICSIILTSTNFNKSFFSDQQFILILYGVVFITGVARGFLGPAVFSMMGQLLDKRLLKNGVTWNSTVWELSSITGLALGGIMYGFIGAAKTYLIQLLLISLAFGFCMFIAAKPLPEYNKQETMSKRIKEGISFVFRHNLILSAISLDLFAVLFGGAVALLPFFAGEILHVGPKGLGILRAAPSIGALVMAFILAHYPLNKNAGIKLLVSVSGFGISIILFALSKSYLLSFFFLLLSGAFDEVSVFIRSTLIHTLTPENMKGRVSSVNNIFIGSSNEIGSFESGALAKLLGVIPSVILGGLLTQVVVAITAWRSPKLRSIELDQLKPYED